MPAFKRILLATDLSECAACADLFAVELAKQFPGSIDLVYVYEDIMPYAGIQVPVSEILWSKLALESRGRVESKLTALARTLSTSAQVPVKPVLLSGSPAYELDLYARRHCFDCMILATHGRRGIERAMLGSVAERVIRHSPCPTFVVNAKEPPARTPAFKKIVLTTDLSANADAARPFAMELASQNHGAVHLVHVFEDQLYYSETDPGWAKFKAVMPEERSSRQGRLNAYAHQAGMGDSHVVHFMERGDPADKINLYAQSIDADCIVIATHGRTGLSHFLIGSVAERVVRNATCPVLCIKPQHTSVDRQPIPASLEIATQA